MKSQKALDVDRDDHESDIDSSSTHFDVIDAVDEANADVGGNSAESSQRMYDSVDIQTLKVISVGNPQEVEIFFCMSLFWKAFTPLI